MRAAGYIRVSTAEQADKGWNLGEDRRLIEARCESEGWELVEIYDDGGRQGDDPDRPGLRALLDSLGDLDVVLMRSQDRISRDIGIWAVTSAALRAAGVRVETFSGPIDLESPAGEFMANVMASVGKFEKRQTGQRVKQAMQARAGMGLHPGGPAPYGYRWEDKALVTVPHEAGVVRRIYGDYVAGMGQRAVVRALNESRLPTRHGGQWQQSAVVRVLSSVLYTGKLEFKGEVMPGAHEAILSEGVWNRAQEIRTGALRRKGGRHPEGGHLLARGVLRCTCGSAMIPRKARAGVERDRYVCRGRIEHGQEFCSQPSIRRELVDEPFMAHLLDGYIDIEATQKRIEERTGSALTGAREALKDAEAELLRKQESIVRIERDYLDGKLPADDWTRFKARLADELEGAKRALQRAQEHVHETEEAGLLGDAEQVLLDHLAALKRAVTAQAGAAPDLAALRNVIGQMFEAVQLVAWEDGSHPLYGHDDLANASPRPRLAVKADGQRYWLFPKLRWSAVDTGTFKPTGQEIPVGSIPQYPPSVPNPFLCRYCWW